MLLLSRYTQSLIHLLTLFLFTSYRSLSCRLPFVIEFVTSNLTFFTYLLLGEHIKKADASSLPQSSEVATTDPLKLEVKGASLKDNIIAESAKIQAAEREAKKKELQAKIEAAKKENAEKEAKAEKEANQKKQAEAAARELKKKELQAKLDQAKEAQTKKVLNHCH